MSVITNSKPAQLQSLAEADLQNWLSAHLSSRSAVGLATAVHACRVFDITAGDDPLMIADPDSQAVKLLKNLAGKGLLKRIDLVVDDLNTAHQRDPNWQLIDATKDDIADWKAKRDVLFGQGRGKPISDATRRIVWHDAGGRCMYRGCGIDLGRVPLTTKAGHLTYFAHIVASDSDGPRGNSNSHALSDEPSNIMLMCDGHHRLIDRFDEPGHPVAHLQQMRDEHRQRVDYLLDGLTYPSTSLITLLADLAQVPTNAAPHELNDSALSRRLGPKGPPIHAIRRTQRDGRASPDFWCHLLREHEHDIRNYILLTGNHASQQGLVRDVLAIFPLHLIPILFLAGRIVGEARGIEVFQYDRHRKSWRWNENENPSAAGSIFTSPLPTATSDEVAISLELTAQVVEDSLPTELAEGIRTQRIPWVRISHQLPNYNCIQTAEDLDQFTQVARKVVTAVQDQLRAKRVHLIGVSPASTVFRFGQLLQAGHHPVYQLYDRPDGASQFIPAMTVDGNEIKASSSTSAASITIALR